jgi:hypothetical protein
MPVAELIRLHRESRFFMERTAVLMSPKPLRRISDRTPALLQLLWDRYGVLPRNLVFVEVTHPKVPYVHENRFLVTAFEQDRSRGSIVSVELRFGFMEEPNVERALQGMARLQEIDLLHPPARVDRPCLEREPAACAKHGPARPVCDSGCSCFCACSPAPRIISMASAMKCSCRPRPCR